MTPCCTMNVTKESSTDREWLTIWSCGQNGVILNSEPEKFQFGVGEADFTAFHISPTEVKPLSKYLDVIRCFPRPSNITDVRAWFGLVNQVARHSKLIDLMAPFKPLWSPRSQFQWSDALEHALQQSKTAIIQAIVHRVEIYDPRRITCLQTDYSGTGLGYWLRQKYCSCASELPDCCAEGWKINLAGSRFLQDAEQRCATVEGECLAVAWALEVVHTGLFQTHSCYGPQAPVEDTRW